MDALSQALMLLEQAGTLIRQAKGEQPSEHHVPPIHTIPPSNPVPTPPATPPRVPPGIDPRNARHRANFMALFGQAPIFAHRYLYAAYRWNQSDQAWIDNFTLSHNMSDFRNRFDSGFHVPDADLLRINDMAKAAELWR